LSAKAIQLGVLQFASKKSLLEHCHGVLHRYEIGARVTEDDAAFLLLLLERHHERDQKVGAGLSHFTVATALPAGRCFLIHRIDGTVTDFSFNKCISPPAIDQRLHAALRLEIDEHVKLAKKRFFIEHSGLDGRVACNQSGQSISFEEAHADHALPLSFWVLAETFLQATNILTGTPLDETLLAPLADQQFGRPLARRWLAEKWRQFHNKLAHIQIVTRQVNLKLAHLAKPRPSDRQLVLPLGGDLL
jgi:Protein of unknown function (DUF3223)